MTTTAADLLTEVLHDPDDMLLRLLYADALEEEAVKPWQRARAQYIRFCVQARADGVSSYQKGLLLDRASALRNRYRGGARTWTRAEAAAMGFDLARRDCFGNEQWRQFPRWHWRNGFIRQLVFRPEQLKVETLQVLFARHPLEEVDLVFDPTGVDFVSRRDARCRIIPPRASGRRWQVELVERQDGEVIDIGCWVHLTRDDVPAAIGKAAAAAMDRWDALEEG